jgi:hypothetical protein
MQQVVVPHDVSSFQVICDECLSTAGTDGAVARLVSGTIPDGERQGVAFCPAGHRVDALQVDQGLSEAAMIGHAA